jgi:hypothetical protein
VEGSVARKEGREKRSNMRNERNIEEKAKERRNKMR